MACSCFKGDLLESSSFFINALSNQFCVVCLFLVCNGAYPSLLLKLQRGQNLYCI
ncbi:hypothetical protein [uncultured Methanobrevibacter sp.]|uniref:hypothetical protein n=1 Tax=uncultured Methanobrevibacter sp. TaxID=253161 RepID=UPI0026270416